MLSREAERESNSSFKQDTRKPNSINWKLYKLCHFRLSVEFCSGRVRYGNYNWYPPAKFAALADTGSDLVWVQCSPCSNYPNQTDPLFDPNKSSTYQKMPCTDSLCNLGVQFPCNTNSTWQYDYEYGGAVETGDLSYETIQITSTTGNTTTSSEFAFGCGHNDTGDLSNLDGLVGLAGGPLSFSSQLGSLFGNKFSYCLVSYDDSSNKTSAILFGDYAVPKVATQYTPMIHNPHTELSTFYYIGLDGINVNGVSVNIPNGTMDMESNGLGGTVSDCGTTLTLLLEPAYTPSLQNIESLIDYPKIANSSNSLGYDLCYNLSSVPSPTFPQVTMVFDGFSLDLPQENTFLVVDDHNSMCLAFGSASEAGIPLYIFGSVNQQNFQVLYDREAKRFGFAKVQCDTLTSG